MGGITRTCAPAGMTVSSTVRVRPATLIDVAVMAEIEVVAFSDPWPASAFRDLLSASHARITVAVDAHDLAVGYCVVLQAADEAEIANIAVAQARRAQGIAGRLLDLALKEASISGVTTVYLEVRLSNTSARALYLSRGFRQVGRRAAYYRFPTEDALVLRRDQPAMQ